MSTGSLAYRRHEAEIFQGDPPIKYRRLLPYINGARILEIGAAEGVLALLMAEAGAQVTALEQQPDRHAAALALQQRWRELGRKVDGATMVCGDIRQRYDLLDGVDTLVAVRTVYHLRESLEAVFTEVAKRVPSVVLCGNANRAERYRKSYGYGDAEPDYDPFNYFAGVDGMTALLHRHGYDIGTTVSEGDPIVTGHR